MTRILLIVSLILVILVAAVGGAFATGLIQLPGAEVKAPVLTQSTQAGMLGDSSAAATSAETGVIFQLAVTDISGSGLSRTVTVQVTNTGNETAHSTWGKVEAYSQEERILLGGEEFIKKDLGNISPKETVTASAVLRFGFTDGIKITRNGARFVLTVNSDETTQSFSYVYSE